MTARQWRYVSSHRYQLKVPLPGRLSSRVSNFRADSVELLTCLQALSFPLTIAHFWPSLMQGERLHLVCPYGACIRLGARVSISMRSRLAVA